MGDTTKKIVKKIKQTSEAIGDFLYTAKPGFDASGVVGKKKKYGSQTKMGDYSKKRPQGGWKD